MECGSQIHQLLNVVAIVVDHFSPVYKRTETQSWHNPVELFIHEIEEEIKNCNKLCQLDTAPEARVVDAKDY